jgi:hypothetical protein
MDGAALLTAASPDWRARPFLAAGELAFAGWLRIATPPGESAGRAAPAADSGPNQDAAASAPGGGKVAAVSASEDEGGAGHEPLSDGSPDQAGDVARKKAGGAAGQDEGMAKDSSRPPAVEFRPADGISNGGPSAKSETGAGVLEGEARGPAADRPAPPLSASPEPASAPRTPARDITLRLNEGDQRVDVRLVERQGDVRVEVRTPDAGLAGDLRRDLPSLAARLEQSGIRADAWRGESGGRRFSGSDSPPAEQDANAGQGRRDGREGRDDPPRRSPPPGEEQIDPKEERKEFEWFMSSHR